MSDPAPIADLLTGVRPRLEEISRGEGDVGLRADAYAAALRALGAYRWVGIYRLSGGEISLLGYAGASAPAYPTFPATKGLSGVAVRTLQTIVSNDVANDPRYLTAFDSTGSEMIVPVISGGTVLGTLDIESDQTDAFGDNDRLLMERCAAMLGADRRLYPDAGDLRA
jgi:GAF domain-containing protein